ncbi:Glutathione S-transferase-like protein FUS3 [Fusarium oxysporum f. sp. cubense]|uniref:Glutathione S-transferase-like protein FUS3 n=1 Tax=Fusarium oxysporum f. sp. cubense TaxID=61366 RepID=A0A559LRG7_FUSOC|nr:Glutathione S-transferase-like protein FUS3 [Fusarium oxysporum f. sp. cubense]
MGSLGTIWTYPFNPRTMKIEAVALFNGRTIDFAPDFVMNITNKTPEFLLDFPMGKVPTFKSTQGGLKLFESDAIAQYAAENGPASAQLLGTTAEERALIRQWIGFADHELFPPLTTMVMWRFGMAPFDEESERSAFQSLDGSLAILEKHLQGRKYLASQDISLADISVLAGLYWGFSQVIDEGLRAKYSQTTEWYLRVIQNKHVAAAFGAKNFIDVRKTAP